MIAEALMARDVDQTPMVLSSLPLCSGTTIQTPIAISSMKTGMQNLAYNMSRLVVLERGGLAAG